MKVARIGLVLALALRLAGRAEATEVEGVAFAPRFQAGGVTMVLNNAALLRYRIVIKAYVAALYIGEGVDAARVLDDVPKRLEIEYFWSIKGADFAKAGDKGIADNVDAATLARLRPRIERLNALYTDVKPGDRYALTYLPGVGTELALNGKPRGVIEGHDFATALFSVWLGRNALDSTLRDDLLARR